MILAATLLVLLGGRAPKDPCACLPPEVTCETVVRAPLHGVTLARKPEKPEAVTVRQELARLKARCTRKMLVDGTGRPIKFYWLRGCWGNPPEDADQILAAQEKELEALRKGAVVIELTCNPEGALIQ